MEDILSVISTVRPALRLCAITRQDDKACGFHLSRTQWDPYPWISNVEEGSPAADGGLMIGDFVIEVNGEDILGMKIDEVAQKVRVKSDAVRLLVWKSAVGETERLPAIFNLNKFSSFLQSTLQLIECPVCMEVTSSSAYQCTNGHILCGNCRQKTLRCPMCRVPLTGKGRCLLVEKLHALIKSTLSSTDCEKRSEAESKTKEISEGDCVIFCCPYSDPCGAKLKGEQAVLQHLASSHSGPIIQYRLRRDFITLSIPPHPFTLSISRHDTVFFLRILPTRQCWISVMGELNKAANLQLSVQCNGVKYFNCASPLSETNEYILAEGKYFNLPILFDKLGIMIKETKGISR